MKINIKRLAKVSLLSLLLSLLYVYIMMNCNAVYFFKKDLEIFLHFDLLFFLILFGYGEMFVSYIIAILLIKYIPIIIIKRIIHCILWFAIFSCVESFFICCLFHMRPGDTGSPFDIVIYFSPFFIKILFFIYYKYKAKQEYKKKQIESETN